MISMLAMAAMVSCTNEIENPDQPKVNENEPVAITFGSSIVGIQTKAVTESSTQFEMMTRSKYMDTKEKVPLLAI